MKSSIFCGCLNTFLPHERLHYESNPLECVLTTSGSGVNWTSSKSFVNPV